jgi:hypothetical protein
MFMLLVMLATGSSKPVPIDPGQWITADDYPLELPRGYYDGTTGFSVEVDTQGNVRRCSVRSTSGDSILDKQTCRLLSARAHFWPARDEKGNPIRSTYTSRVVWDAPGYAPEGSITVSVDQGVAKCVINASQTAGGSENDLDFASCQALADKIRDAGEGFPKTVMISALNAPATAGIPPN